MQKSCRPYIESLDLVVQNSRLDLTVSVVPLAIISTQVQALSMSESLSLKILATLLVLVFSIRSALALIFLLKCRYVLTKEVLYSEGDPDKGKKMLDFTKRTFLKEGQDYDEEYLLSTMKRYAKVQGVLLLPSWGLVIAALVVAIWQ